VLELTTQVDGDAFRAIYTVRFEHAVYVLHSIKKKLKQGIKTPKSEVDLVRRRLAEAETDYATFSKDGRS
jgi:phage-related protein